MTKSLIETFKRDVESFEEKFKFRSSAIGDPAVEYVGIPNIIQDIKPLKRHLTATTLNLIDKMIEGCEGRKKGMTIEKIKAEPDIAKASSMGMELGYDYSLSATISQLQELKEYLSEELKK